MIGLGLGYSLALFAPDLSAAIARRQPNYKKSPSTSTATTSYYTPRDFYSRLKPGEGSKATNAYCEPATGQYKEYATHICSYEACGYSGILPLYGSPASLLMTQGPDGVWLGKCYPTGL